MAWPGSATDDEAAASRVLADYYSAFSTLEIQAILPCFHEPCMLISPQSVFVASSSAVLAMAIAPVMDGLRARGYGRSELSIRRLQSLSATAILAIGVALRYKLDGQELERVGVTYVLHKADTGWKIAVLIVHDTKEVARQE